MLLGMVGCLQEKFLSGTFFIYADNEAKRMLACILSKYRDNE